MTAEIEAFVEGLSKELAYSSRAVDGMLAFSFVYGEKVVEFRWPELSPEEVWIALFSSPANFEAGIADLVMFEVSATEFGKEEILRFLETVAWRYLKAQTRLRRRWVMFGAKVLEYFHESEWKDIYFCETNSCVAPISPRQF